MRKLLLFSFALISWATHAQFTISGKVTDAVSGQPIPGAVLSLEPAGVVQSVSTDQTGFYSISVAEPRSFVVIIHSLGYQDARFNWRPSEDAFTSVRNIQLETDVTELSSVELSAIRAGENDPFAFTNVEKEELVKLNSGRDIPYLLEQTPGLVATSDAGAGVGYTNMRVRGSDISRINVTMNGIPMNDAESHGVWWVNTPDLASSTGSIQLQRGVGTSTNGAGAFGASLNMESGDVESDAYGSVHLGAGSFNTKRATLQLGSGLINDHWWVSGRFSKIVSDGWVDRASSDLTSQFLSAGYVNKKTKIRAVYFGGGQQTYQAWYGVDSATLATNPTFNYAGAIYDDEGNIVDFYDNETDNYKQDHFQLHWNQKLGDYWSMNLSGHYTYGRGFYEQYIQDGDMVFYGMTPIISGDDTISTTDLIQQKWLDNDFYGGIFNFSYQKNALNLVIGGGIHQYEGRHFGEVIWSRFASDTEKGHRYYESYSNKLDVNTYIKASYDINSDLQLFGDLQVRSVNYKASGTDDGVGAFAFEQDNLFFNPKIGLTYFVNPDIRTHFSYAVANKEPNRTDLIYADPNDLPKPENLQDVEVGVDWRINGHQFQANVFYMYYNNQLVLTGEIDNVGYPIRDNVGKSYRSGIELIWNLEVTEWFRWMANASFSQNRNLDMRAEQGDGTVERLGNTNISFSPNVIAASTLQFIPAKDFTVELFSKYVGEQYMSNFDNNRHKLDAYFVNDLRLSYTVHTRGITGLRLYFNVQNMFDTEYVSNGYIWGDPYYFPQAGINFMGGIQLDL